MNKLIILLLVFVIILSLPSCKVNVQTGLGNMSTGVGRSTTDDTSVDSSSVTDNASSTGNSSGTIGITVPDYTAGEILDYFAEVAFGSEYGDSSDFVCKWTSPIHYMLYGEPTEDDLAQMTDLFDTLNSIQGFPGISETESDTEVNFKIYFVPRSELIELFTYADENCTGMSEIHWYTTTGEIFSAMAAIDVDSIDERRSTICEELLQSLGIVQDSYMYLGSVFYQGRCYLKAPSELDWAIVELLYNPVLTRGTLKIDALQVSAGALLWE